MLGSPSAAVESVSIPVGIFFPVVGQIKTSSPTIIHSAEIQFSVITRAMVARSKAKDQVGYEMVVFPSPFPIETLSIYTKGPDSKLQDGKPLRWRGYPSPVIGPPNKDRKSPVPRRGFSLQALSKDNHGLAPRSEPHHAAVSKTASLLRANDSTESLFM